MGNAHLKGGGFAILAALSLGACSGGSGALVSSGTTAVTGTGLGATANASLVQESNRTLNDAAVGTVAYVAGFNQAGTQAQGLVGIASNPTVGAPVSNGTATYNARYQYIVNDNARIFGGSLGVDEFDESGTITLNADFDAQTVTGTGPELTVNGTVSGSDLGGTVTANYSAGGLNPGTLDATLSGSIGASGVIGAFHGSDENTLVVGGIVGTR